MTKYEEQMVRQVVDGNLDKVDVLDQMIKSGTIKTRREYDHIARYMAYEIIMKREWSAAGVKK